MYRLLPTTLAVALTIALSPSAHAKKKDGKGQKHAPPAAAQHGGNGGGHAQAGQHGHGNGGHKAPQVGAYHAPKAPVVYKAPKASKQHRAQPYVASGSQRSQVHAQNRQPQTVVSASNQSRKYNQRNYNQRNYNQTAVHRTDVSNYQSYTQNRVYNQRVYQPPVTVYRDWDRGHVHHWNNHRYHWYNNAWVILDIPVGGYDSGSLEANVQAALAREGYDPGPIDGVVGGQTRDAIAAYQQDHGLSVTASINDSLIRSLRL